jgi:hypothetical protein
MGGNGRHHTARPGAISGSEQLRLTSATANMRARFSWTDMDSAISDNAPARSRRTRFEIAFASAWLAVGLFGLPAAIYLVGVLLLGPYKPGAGLMQFYADFFGDLAAPTLRAWIIALGPLIIISIVRLLFWGVSPPQTPAAEQPAPSKVESTKDSSTVRSRIEPRIGSE